MVTIKYKPSYEALDEENKRLRAVVAVLQEQGRECWEEKESLRLRLSMLMNKIQNDKSDNNNK